jgi:hypothetical protein
MMTVHQTTAHLPLPVKTPAPPPKAQVPTLMGVTVHQDLTVVQIHATQPTSVPQPVLALDHSLTTVTVLSTMNAHQATVTQTTHVRTPAHTPKVLVLTQRDVSVLLVLNACQALATHHQSVNSLPAQVLGHLHMVVIAQRVLSVAQDTAPAATLVRTLAHSLKAVDPTLMVATVHHQLTANQAPATPLPCVSPVVEAPPLMPLTASVLPTLNVAQVSVPPITLVRTLAI